MKYRITLIFVTFTLALALLFWYFYAQEKRAMENIQSFADCIHNGYPIQESYPRRCVTPDGRSFTEESKNVPVVQATTTEDLISITIPKARDKVKSPLTITGEARGSWYFEASFPIELRDAKGRVMASGTGQAQGDWMTENFVPFTASLTFVNTKEQAGQLVLKKDNPSGLPERDAQIVLPVTIGVSK